MIRFYLSPSTVTASGFRAPKYSDTLPVGTSMDWLDFGNEPTFVWAVDTDVATHATLAANVDVAAFPANIDAQVGANLSTVQTQLEGFNIPGDAVMAGTTYRTILRGIIAIFSAMQRYSALTGNVLVFGAGVNLDRTLGSINVSVRNALQLACDQLHFDTAGLVGTSTIRELLKKLALQPRNVTLLGVSV